MAFRIGQKVVCVDDTFDSLWRAVPNWPSARTIYTVRGVIPWNFEVSGPCVCVFLEEIVNPVSAWRDGKVCEHPFSARRFRPVTEKQTDISCFTEILDRENKNSRVPVSDHQSN